MDSSALPPLPSPTHGVVFVVCGMWYLHTLTIITPLLVFLSYYSKNVVGAMASANNNFLREFLLHFD